MRFYLAAVAVSCFSDYRFLEQSAAPRAHKAFETTDSKQLEIATQVPEFGGLYYHGDTAVITITRAAVAQRAYEIVGAFISQRARHRLDGQPFVTTKVVTYSFQQLNRFKEALLATFKFDGVVFVGIRESRNRVEVGVTSARVEAAVATFARDMLIPATAVATVRTTPPAVQTTYLPDQTGAAWLQNRGLGE